MSPAAARTSLAGLFLAGAAQAQAQTDQIGAALLPMPAAIGAHGLSNHPGSSHKNSQNPGAYVRWATDATEAGPLLAGTQIGVYRNSYRTWSLYVGRHLAGARLGEQLTASLMAGAVAGYPQASLLPMVTGTLSWAVSRKGSINFSAMPKPTGQHVGVYHLSAEWRLQ